MPNIRKLSRIPRKLLEKKPINWYPGHMHSGMQAMMGKLNTVDCVVEVHDARIPFIGRNSEFKKHLGLIKPRLLVLNKSDLADLSSWDRIKNKLADEGDPDVLLTDATGSQFSHSNRGYTNLLNTVVKLVSQSDRNNRLSMDHYQIMIVGIPNVGKSTLINRLRQFHTGRAGEPAKIGAEAGVTRSVHERIKICSRPPIYSLDTPGVLQPGITKNHDQAMRLALCSNINNKNLDPNEVASYLLKFLNNTGNYQYQFRFKLDEPVHSIEELTEKLASKEEFQDRSKPEPDAVSWRFIRTFRRGEFGKVIF